MSTTISLNTASVAKAELMDVIVDSIQDVKGKRIVRLDLRRLHDAPTDVFFVCEGDSTTQVKAIADRISYRVKTDLDILPNHMEGAKESRWICLDYFDVVIHIFHKEARAFYALEELWSDAEITEFEEV